MVLTILPMKDVVGKMVLRWLFSFSLCFIFSEVELHHTFNLVFYLFYTLQLGVAQKSRECNTFSAK